MYVSDIANMNKRQNSKIHESKFITVHTVLAFAADLHVCKLLTTTDAVHYGE